MNSVISDYFATFLESVTLYDDRQQPFTAFVIEVKNGRRTWKIQKANVDDDLIGFLLNLVACSALHRFQYFNANSAALSH